MTKLLADVMWLNGPGEVEIRTEQLRTPADTELICETLFSVISPGTELAAYKGLPPLRSGTGYPRLMGYCNVGRVLEIGCAVKGFLPGDKILSFTSHRSAFLIEEENILYKLPVNALAEDIACTYLFHLGYNAVLRSNVRAGSRVLVIGLGVLGLTTVATASLAGAQVVALSDYTSPSSIALQMGAEAVFNRNDLTKLTQYLGSNLADVVVVTTNNWTDWQVALETTRMLGTIAVLGFPGRTEPIPPFNPLHSEYFYNKQLRIEAVGLSPEQSDSRGFCRFNERENLEYLTTQITRGRLNASLLISDCYAGENLNQAYLDLINSRLSPITYLLKWNNI